MPVTKIEYPVLSSFLSVAAKTIEMSEAQQQRSTSNSSNSGQDGTNAQDTQPKKLRKGVVLGKDGKPCRSCMSISSWIAMSKGQNSTSQTASQTKGATETAAAAAAAASALELPEGCPPDVEHLGRSTWTLLHSMTANYPDRPSASLQQQTKSFISLFANMYPCSHCADDFQQWMREDGNSPRLSNRDEFGRWMCEAHNAVNTKLGKDKFDCSKWEERWRTGPPDGRCG